MDPVRPERTPSITRFLTAESSVGSLAQLCSPITRGELCRRAGLMFETALRVADERAAAALKTMFGASHLDTLQLRRGSFTHRAYDRQIAVALLPRIIDGTLEKPYAVLEVGAGRSLGDGVHTGSPWLARELSLLAGGRGHFTVTDLNDNRTLYFVSPNGSLYQIAQLKELPLSRVMTNSAGALVADRVTFAEISSCCSRRASGRLYDLVFEKSGCNPKRQGALYVRPALDAEFEANVFGLEVQVGVDYIKGSSRIKSSGFDFVFGRHLVPTRETERQNCEDNVRLWTRADAGYILNFDTSLFIYDEANRKDPSPLSIPSPSGKARDDLVSNVPIRYPVDSLGGGLYRALTEAVVRHENTLVKDGCVSGSRSTGLRAVLDKWRFG